MAKRIMAFLLMAMLLSGMPLAMAETNVMDVTARDVVLNRMTDSLGIHKDGYTYYQLIDSRGNPLTQAIYIDMRAVSGFPFFKVQGESSDGIHNEGLIDDKGTVIVPAEYADVEVVSEHWQYGVRLTPSEADDKDYTISNWSNNEKLFFRIDTVDFFFDGQKAGTLNRSQFGDSYCTAHGAYICVTDRAKQRIFYNRYMEASPYTSESSSEYDSVYKNGKTTYYHAGTGQAAFTAECTLNPSEVENPYLYDRGILYGLQGQQIFRPAQNYDSIRSFKNGYAQVSMNRYYGLIDENGNEIIPPEYEALSYTEYPLQYGYIGAAKDGKFGFLDKDGNVTCDFVYSKDIVSDRGTFASLKNLDGTIIVLSAAVGELPEHFSEVSFAGSDGSMAFVAQNASREYCLIDLYGNTLIPYSGEYRSIEVNRDATVAVASCGNRTYKIYSFTHDRNEQLTASPDKAEDGTESWTCENGHEGNTGKYCTECGAPRTYKCANCGYEFPDGKVSKFCPECGKAQG